MATDATGTPTSPLGIPKYNTAADIPSGKGFNAAMDYIDDLIESRAATPTGIASGEAMVWNGTTWARSSATKIEPTSLKPAGRGIALPGTPYDGQEYVLVDSLTATTYAWRFRYDSAFTGTHKWEFVGGEPVSAFVETGETTTSTAYTDLATVGPSVTVPRAGEYHILFGSRFGVADATNSWGRMTIKLGAAATSDVEAIIVGSSAAIGTFDSSASRLLKRTLAAADVLKAQYKNETGPNAQAFYSRWMAVAPIRVS